MSFYERRILPRLLDLAMRHREIARYRERIVPRAAGRVVEIGIGSGLNLPYYRGIEGLHGIDPSDALLDMSRRRLHAAPFPVALSATDARTLPLEDASADSAVITFTLCTIRAPLEALREVRRVLKPGGALHFAEHGLAPDAAVERWQRRLNPLWRRVAGGCNLDRRIDALLAEAGFEIDEIAREYADGPRPLSFIYFGSAKNP